MSENDYPKVGGRSAKIALVLLVIVYIFNFVDRQILSVLAEEIKADLNITDSDLGFLFAPHLQFFIQFLEFRLENWRTLGLEKIY